MKLLEMKKMRWLSFAFVLVLAFGLFAGCSSQNTEISADPSDQVSEEPSQEPSDDLTESDAETDGGEEADGEDSDTSDIRNVVGQVTAIDGETVTIQICTASSEVEITNYGTVDMSLYSTTGDTVEVDLSEGLIAAAQDEALTPADSSQIAVGDMLLLSYSIESDALLQTVIYAA